MAASVLFLTYVLLAGPEPPRATLSDVAFMAGQARPRTRGAVPKDLEPPRR